MTYAGFWRRFAAVLIDALIIYIPSAMFSGLAFDIMFSFGIGLVLNFLYYPFFESSQMQATPGKALLGMVVGYENAGERITFRTAVVRFFGRYLSGLVLCIGYLMQAFTTKRQTLHDMIAEVVVIRKEQPADLNYFKVWRTQLKEVIAKL